MIIGSISQDGVPVITLQVAGQQWPAIVDTGFNGDLELPTQLFSILPHTYLGRTKSTIAAGREIEEDSYEVQISFDGEAVPAEVTFAPGDQILLGTNLLRGHRVEIDFPAGTVTLQRA